jgi:serine/threonine protein kinase
MNHLPATGNDLPATGNGSMESLVGQVVDEFIEGLERGEQPDVEEFAGRHPEAAGVLRQVLQALQLVRLSGPPSGASGPAAAAEAPVTAVLGDFRIVREVGRGGMGVVYEAEQTSLGRRVALKVLPFAATLDPRHLQRFQNEARAAAGLHHTNIVPVYAVGCERGVHFYAMQFIDGHTLAELIAGQRSGQPTATPTVDEADAGSASTVPQAAQVASAAPRDPAHFRRVAAWGIQAAAALDHAHQLGVVHRDVKPANLLVDGGGRLWVTDFGLAQVQSDARLTMTGDLVGTLRYMSPEQALAKRVVIDHRTDVYSLGATLYELLTLRPVFGGRDRQELLRQIAFEEPTPPRRLERAVPAELATIVLKALEKRPPDRYATAQEMADDLERWLRDEPIRARRPTLFQRAAKWGRRHRPVVVAGVTVLLMALVLASYLGWVHHGREMQRAATERAVLMALEESDSWQAQRRLPEALSAARRAVGLLAGGDADDVLRQRVRGRVADLELLDKMQNARLERTAVPANWGYHFQHASGLPLYEQAFREAGLDVEALPRGEVAERISASTVAADLAGVLDDWAWYRRGVKGDGDTGWKDLLWIARAAEPEAWRNGVRDALECRDLKALAALAASDKVFRLMPPTLYVLGDALLQGKGMYSQAEGMLREAQRRQPDDFWLNLNLLYFFSALQPSREDALRFASAAVAIRPRSPGARLYLGNALCAKGQLDEAIAEYREAIRLKEDYAEAHWDLGNALRQKGQFAEALVHWRRGHELGYWIPSDKFAQVVQNCERFVELDGKLPEVLSGHRKPADIRERLAFAWLCQQPFQKRYAAAARFYDEAFTEKPQLADDLAGHRYDAACAAALAGCGQGADADQLDPQERARLRQQALDWLRAGLKAKRQMLEQSPGKDGPTIVTQMQHWLQDVDFAGVRGAEALARLPQGERPEWE